MSPTSTIARSTASRTGGHIYTLNKDLESIAQKSDDDKYRVVARSNFHIPEKAAEKSNHLIIEHIDEMLEILRQQSSNNGEEEEEQESEEKLIYMIHKKTTTWRR